MTPTIRPALLIAASLALAGLTPTRLALSAETESAGCACEILEPGIRDAVSSPPIHDPAIAKEHGTYYVYSTGPGLSITTSKNLKEWKPAGRVFPKAVSWSGATIPGSTDHYWAPDISYFGKRWHLYYSVSTFGKNRSAIGLATSPTLDPARPDYAWKDEGVVIESNPGDDYNCIDPNLVLDEKGQPWLSFGSFWSGLKLIALDASTGKPKPGSGKPIPIASRPNGPPIHGAIEAPFVYRHGGYYYLFASFDACCRGANSTYNVRVGRSKTIQGPYSDRDGKPMLEGGGTSVINGGARWKGTGHNAVLRDGRSDWLICHAYDATDNGVPRLRVHKLQWPRDGWPQLEKPED